MVSKKTSDSRVVQMLFDEVERRGDTIDTVARECEIKSASVLVQCWNGNPVAAYDLFDQVLCKPGTFLHLVADDKALTHQASHVTACSAAATLRCHQRFRLCLARVSTHEDARDLKEGRFSVGTMTIKKGQALLACAAREAIAHQTP